jgi:ABC transport system ATP-binding/permease protein
LLRGELDPSAGTVRKADSLRTVYFDQNRELDPNLTLRRALAPDSDSVIYQDRVTHVASWAARFLFSAEDLNRPVGRLSGGERARVLVAQLMLQPADVLLLDEPTNDLDIPTLEILEENLLEYRGALVLITHDRYMLDRVSTVVFGLDGLGHAERFADYSQWDAWQVAQNSAFTAEQKMETKRSPAKTEIAPVLPKSRLTHTESRELASIEKQIAKAEQTLFARRATLEDKEIASDASRLQTAFAEMEAAQKAVDSLYQRWSELDRKNN